MLWHCQHYQSKPVSVAVSHQLDNKTEIKVILFPKVSFFLTINHSFSQQKLTVFIFWLYLEFLIFQNTVFRIFFSADENMYNVECDQICSNFLNAMQYITQYVKWLLGSPGYHSSHSLCGTGMVASGNIWFCSYLDILSYLSPWGHCYCLESSAGSLILLASRQLWEFFCLSCFEALLEKALLSSIFSP